jgi:dolichol-phosphate mannosyltransferase
VNPEISVVVPLRNEGSNVKPLVERIVDAFGQAASSLEIILVDDGSTDETWQRITEQTRAHPQVRGLQQPHNCGQSAALWRGFRESRAAVLATLDGDLQNDPADLPQMVAGLADADMICGVRTRRADNWVRRRSSGVARVFRKAMLGAHFVDSGCNLRVFKREMLQHLPGFDGIHRFMPYFVQNVGGRVKEVPVRHHPRIAGVSKYGVWNRMGRGIRDLIMVRWYLKRQIGNTRNGHSPKHR